MATKTKQHQLPLLTTKENTFSFSTIVMEETKSLMILAFPIALTTLIFYSRSMISMMFLGYLGELELAAGSLAIAFANITGYSVISGLSLGMEPLCSQAFGANNPKLLSLTLQRCILFLVLCSIPISVLWLNMSQILVSLHQQQNITSMAQTYLIFSLPDLITNSFIHPIRIYLRAQGITHPVTITSLAGTLLHIPLSYFLFIRLGFAGVPAASAASNLLILFFLIAYLRLSGLHRATWITPSREILTGWKPLLRFAAPSCISVCLEWWWYEVMIVLCGLLVDPTVTVASMGILIQTTSFINVFPSSLGFAVSARVGNKLGANRPSQAKLSSIVGIFFAVIMGFLATVFTMMMRFRWGRIFTTNENILSLTSLALPILGLCELGNCPQTVGCGVVRGMARPCVAANVNLGAFYMVGMPVAVVLTFWLDIGFRGLWLGLFAAQVCCAGLMLYVIGVTDWDFEAVRAHMLTSVDCVEIGKDKDDGVMNGQKPLLTDVVTET